MKKILFTIIIIIPCIIISCKSNINHSDLEPSQPSSFDELFYQNYKGISADIFDSTGHGFCCNEKSFFEIKKDNTINLRICGIITGTNDSIDYRSSGKIEIWNKSYVLLNVPLDEWYYAYWSFESKITIGNRYSYMNCRLYISFGGDARLDFENGLQIDVNAQTYFLITNLLPIYQKLYGC